MEIFFFFSCVAVDCSDSNVYISASVSIWLVSCVNPASDIHICAIVNYYIRIAVF